MRRNSIANYIQLMYPYVSIARVMGFLPYKIESSKFVYFKPCFILSTFVILGYVTLSSLCLYKVQFHYINVQFYKSVLQRVHPTCITILGPILFISAFASNRSVLRVIQRISHFSRILPPKTFSSMAKRMYTKDMLMLFPLLSYIPFVFTANRIILSCASWITFFGVLVIHALYVNNIHLLEACLKEINDALVRVKESLINDEPHVLRRVYHTRNNPMLLAELRMLKGQHLEISEIVKRLNSVFGASNLTTFTLLFIDVLFNLYKYLVVLNQGGRLTEWFSFILVFILYYVAHVTLIIWSVEKARTQAKQVGSNIHRIVVHTFDKEITNELKLFSLQVLQREITFTAKGLAIDATLLTKAVGVITTFFLILVQFLVKPC